MMNEQTGEIWARAKFDREKNDSFILEVEARDSAPSSLPGATGPNTDIVKIQIQINDVSIGEYLIFNITKLNV